MAMKDPYEVLGISKTATQDEVRTAYRNLAKKLHPDLNPGNKSTEKKFKEVAAAYELIGTPEQRGKFNRGETPEQQQERAQEQARSAQGRRGPFYQDTQQSGGRYTSSFGQGADENDLFENLFRSARQQRKDYPGEDLLFQMSVDFKDAALGTEHEITLPLGKPLKVKIPPGVETGTKLRFKGRGGAGVGQGPAGDAYVEIHVRPLEGFVRVGKNIETQVAVSFIEALLGAEIPVPTIDGSVKMTIPPGANTGSRFRVRGKGVRTSTEERGDQIVELKVLMPKTVDPALKEAVRSWERKFNYNPRAES